ncbi:hypothetical protein DFH28DRAFT_959798 [Melampsora americana]|nr:hypothetical protein DFH28DRAFT_959798 [Melampsora americana]
MRLTHKRSCLTCESMSIYLHLFGMILILSFFLNLVMVYFLRLFFEFPLGEDFKGFLLNYIRQLPKTILFMMILGLMFLAIGYLISHKAPITSLTNDNFIELNPLPLPVTSTMKPLLPLIIITAPLKENIKTNSSSSRESNQNQGTDDHFLKVPSNSRLRTSRLRSHYPHQSINLTSKSFTNLSSSFVGHGLMNKTLDSGLNTHGDI